MLDKPELPFYLWSSLARFLSFDCEEKTDVTVKTYYTGLAGASKSPTAIAWFAKEYARKAEADVR